MLVFLLEAADLLLFRFKVCLKTIILRLKLIDLVLELGHLSVPCRLLSFMSEHQLSLLGLSPSGSLLNLSFASVEVLPLLIELSLEVEHLALLLLLEEFELLGETLIELTLLLVPLVQVRRLADLIS